MNARGVVRGERTRISLTKRFSERFAEGRSGKEEECETYIATELSNTHTPQQQSLNWMRIMGLRMCGHKQKNSFDTDAKQYNNKSTNKVQPTESDDQTVFGCIQQNMGLVFYLIIVARMLCVCVCVSVSWFVLARLPSFICTQLNETAFFYCARLIDQYWTVSARTHAPQHAWMKTRLLEWMHIIVANKQQRTKHCSSAPRRKRGKGRRERLWLWGHRKPHT